MDLKQILNEKDDRSSIFTPDPKKQFRHMPAEALLNLRVEFYHWKENISRPMPASTYKDCIQVVWWFNAEKPVPSPTNCALASLDFDRSKDDKLTCCSTPIHRIEWVPILWTGEPFLGKTLTWFVPMCDCIYTRYCRDREYRGLINKFVEYERILRLRYVILNTPALDMTCIAKLLTQ